MQTIEPAAVLNRDQLREITMGDLDLMREILAAVIDDTSKQLRLLAAAIEEQDAAGLRRLAHYSKGACANVGAQRIALLLERIERDARAGAFPECGHSLESLADEIELLRAESV